MKQSNLSTPRTLSECEFITRRHFSPERDEKRTRWWHVAITLVAMSAIGAILAYRG